MTFKEKLELFGLSKSYTQEELTTQYRVLVKKVHPDINSDSNSKVFILLNEIYEELKDLQGEEEEIALLVGTPSKRVIHLRNDFFPSYKRKNLLSNRLSRYK